MGNKFSAFFVVTVAFMLFAYQQAFGASLNSYSVGILVPYATFSNSSATTVAGITTNEAGTIYWTFFDQDGAHVDSGNFPVIANQMHPFNWSTEGDASLAGTKGYLLFTIDTNGDGKIDTDDWESISANSFYVDISTSYVVYIPTVCVVALGLTTTDPATYEPRPYYGACSSSVLDMRYYVDGSPGGEDTKIVVWTIGDPGSTQSVTIYDANGNSNGISVDTPHSRLNIVDPEAIADRPSNFLDGFVRWTVPAGAVSAYSFSIIHSSAFGAIQTLVAGRSF
jgi:hypothetical protein